MASLQAPQTATVDKFIAGWKKPFAEEMLAILSDDVTQQALRLSLGRPSRARAQVEATLPKLGQILTNYSLTIHNLVHDVEEGKAIVYAMSWADTPFGIEWKNEYAFFLTLNATMERITKLEGMVDSAFMKSFNPFFGSI